MAIETKQALTPTQKRTERFQRWQYPEGVPLANADVKQAYERRVQMFRDVIELKKPERIPVFPVMGFYPCLHAGITAQEAMYDHTKLALAHTKYYADFLPDALSGAILTGPGSSSSSLTTGSTAGPGTASPRRRPTNASRMST